MRSISTRTRRSGWQRSNAPDREAPAQLFCTILCRGEFLKERTAMANPSESDFVLPTPTVEEIIERKSLRALNEHALETIFSQARTANGFLDRNIPHEILGRALELAELGPTSANMLPMRVIFVESTGAKAKLEPALSEGNRDKTMAAPVTAIMATDLRFFEHFPRLFPERGEMFKERFAGLPPDVLRAHAWDNAVLQMAYFIIALRAVGLDAGPMAGFDRHKVDAAFMPDGRFVSQYLINIGYGDDSKVFPRLPRFEAHDIAEYV
jgi:3-hydroxypropanoate dehydrogenase